MRKYFFLTLAFFFCAFSASAGTLRLGKDVDLAGITEISFELSSPSIVFGFSTARYDHAISGSGGTDTLSLSLDGDISASQESALPRLLVDRQTSRLIVRLYEKVPFLFLTQTGTARFAASIPDGFTGRVSVSSSSGNITLSGLKPGTLEVNSSSGSIFGSALSPGEAAISVSSGSIKISDISAGKARVDSSSGSIEIGSLTATDGASVEASSGSIRLDRITGSDLRIKSSAGGVNVGDFSGNLFCGVSSGSVRLAASKLSGNLTVKSSSGGVTLELPSDTAFSAALETSAGSIRSDFTLIGDALNQKRGRVSGDANGGGYSVKIGVSSGGIKLIARPQ